MLLQITQKLMGFFLPAAGRRFAQNDNIIEE